MIKTIKVKKQLKFVELLQWIKTNDIQGREFKDVNREYYFSVLEGGFLNFDEFTYDNDALYEVEVEEEITSSTIFDCLVRVGKDGVVERTHCSISGMKNENTIRIYALLDEELQLIWEAK